MCYNELSMRSSYVKIAHVFKPVILLYNAIDNVLAIYSPHYVILLITSYRVSSTPHRKMIVICAFKTYLSIQCHIRMTHCIRVMSQRSL